jgi:hypothetical protein
VLERNKAASGKERWVERKTVIYLTDLDIWRTSSRPRRAGSLRSDFPRQSWVAEHFRTIEAPRNLVAT